MREHSAADRSRMAGIATAALIATLPLASCGLWPGEPAVPFTVQLEQSELDVVPGVATRPGPGAGPNDYVGFVVLRNGYAGTLTYSLELRPHAGAGAVPPGAVIYPNPPGAPDSVGVVYVSYPAGTSPGTYVYRLRATSEAGSAVADVTIRVAPYTARLVQPSLTVARGRTNTLSLDIVRDPGATVTLATSAPPAGITIATESPPAGAYVDVTASAGAPLGTFSLSVTVSGSEKQVTLQLPVTVIATPPTRPVAFRVCRFQGVAPYFRPYRYAYANEGAAWTNVTPDAEDVIRFDATDRVGIAEFYSYPGFYASGPGTRVMYLTATDLEAMQCPSASAGTVSHPVLAPGATQSHVALGALRAMNGSQQTGRRAGVADLVAGASRTVPTGLEYRAIVRRSQNPAPGDTIRLDFASAEAVVLDSAPLAATASPIVRVHTTTTIGRLVTGSATTQYHALPEALLGPGEAQSLFVSTPTAGAVHWFRAAAALTISLGPAVAAPAVDAEAQTITVPAQPEYPDVAGVGQRYTLDYRGIYGYTEVWMSRGYAGSTPAEWVFRRPDLGRSISPRPFVDGDADALAGAGPSWLYFGGRGEPGMALRWGMRSSGTNFGFGLPFPAVH